MKQQLNKRRARRVAAGLEVPPLPRRPGGARKAAPIDSTTHTKRSRGPPLQNDEDAYGRGEVDLPEASDSDGEYGVSRGKKRTRKAKMSKIVETGSDEQSGGLSELEESPTKKKKLDRMAISRDVDTDPPTIHPLALNNAVIRLKVETEKEQEKFAQAPATTSPSDSKEVPTTKKSAEFWQGVLSSKRRWLKRGIDGDLTLDETHDPTLLSMVDLHAQAGPLELGSALLDQAAELELSLDPVPESDPNKPAPVTALATARNTESNQTPHDTVETSTKKLNSRGAVSRCRTGLEKDAPSVYATTRKLASNGAGFGDQRKPGAAAPKLTTHPPRTSGFSSNRSISQAAKAMHSREALIHTSGVNNPANRGQWIVGAGVGVAAVATSHPAVLLNPAAPSFHPSTLSMLPQAGFPCANLAVTSNEPTPATPSQYLELGPQPAHNMSTIALPFGNAGSRFLATDSDSSDLQSASIGQGRVEQSISGDRDADPQEYHNDSQDLDANSLGFIGDSEIILDPVTVYSAVQTNAGGFAGQDFCSQNSSSQESDSPIADQGYVNDGYTTHGLTDPDLYFGVQQNVLNAMLPPAVNMDPGFVNPRDLILHNNEDMANPHTHTDPLQDDSLDLAQFLDFDE